MLFYVLKSCEKSTKCPYRFVFKSQFVVWSLSIFYFEVFFFLHTPTWVPSIYSFKQLFYKAMLQWVISWCMWWAGKQYRTMCLKFANTKLCFGPVTMLFHWIRDKEKKTHPERDTCIFCKVEKLIPIIKSRVKSNALLSGLCRMWNSLSFVYLWY